MHQNIRIIALIGTLALGSVGSLLILPTIYPHIPTSITRVKRILEVIDDPTKSPRMVVFGNSVAMSGINSYQLALDLDHPGPSYNLAYEGQSLVESYLLHQALDETVETIVQLVMIKSDFESQSLARQKYNNLYMWGYRPSAAAIQKLEEIYGNSVGSILKSGGLAQRFGSRWAIQQYADISIRQLRIDPGSTEYIQTNLVLPLPFPRHNEAWDARVRLRASGTTGKDYRLGSKHKRLIQVMIDESRAAGRRLAIVFTPVHPSVRGLLFKDDLRTLAAYGNLLATNEHVSVINATSVLRTIDFYDELHLAEPGARTLTSLIADSLATAH